MENNEITTMEQQDEKQFRDKILQALSTVKIPKSRLTVDGRMFDNRARLFCEEFSNKNNRTD